MKSLGAFLSFLVYLLSVFFTAIFGAYLLFVYWGPDPSYVFLGKSFHREDLLLQQNRLGLDFSVYEHIKAYFLEIVAWDFGFSFSEQRPALELVYQALPVSFFVGVPAFFLSEFLALGLAVGLCLKKNYWIRKSASFLLLLSLSLPSLMIILACQIVLCSSQGLDLFPVQGWPFEEGLQEEIYYCLAPVLSLVLCLLGPRFHYAYELLRQEFSRDYVLTHRAFGFANFFLVSVQVMKNSLALFIIRGLPRLPFVLFGGLILVEHIFALPGLGTLLSEAARSGDWPVMKVLVFLSAFSYLLARLLTQVLAEKLMPEGAKIKF